MAQVRMLVTTYFLDSDEVGPGHPLLCHLSGRASLSQRILSLLIFSGHTFL